MQDLYPKVANFYSIEDLSYSKEEIKRTLTPWCGGGAVIFTVFMLAYLAWERAKTGDPLILYSMICPLIGYPIIGAFGGYMLFALKTLGYIFWRAMQSLGLLFATSGSKNRLIRFMKNYEPVLARKLCKPGHCIWQKILSFPSRERTFLLSAVPGMGKVSRTSRTLYTGELCRWETAGRKARMCMQDIDLYFCDTMTGEFDEGEKRQDPDDRQGKNIQIPQDPGYSIHQVSCESCGASFDAMKIRHCPYCKREYDMRDHAGTVMKIRKTGGKTS